MTTKQAQANKDLAREQLRDIFDGQDKPKVYTILRHVSQSGMSRDISVKTMQDGQLIDITFLTAQALGDKVKDRNGFRAIRVGGCGMDMGFHLVHSLATALYFGQDRAGYKLSQEWA